MILEGPITFDTEEQSLALVLVDLQHATASRDGGLGRWMESMGMERDRESRFSRIEEVVVPQLSRVLKTFRRRRLPVIHVRLGSQSDSFLDITPSTLRAIENAIGNVRGSDEFEFLDGFKPRADEYVLTKTSASAFTSSPIDKLLRALSIRQLALGGVSTSHCVDMTARDAVDHGYDVLVIEDGVAETRHEHHEMTLELFRQYYGRVVRSDELLTELSSENGLPEKER